MQKDKATVAKAETNELLLQKYGESDANYKRRVENLEKENQELRGKISERDTAMYGVHQLAYIAIFSCLCT